MDSSKSVSLYLAVVLLILFAVYLGISMTLNFESVYAKFREDIAGAGYDAKVSSIEVSHFPVPAVTLGNVEIPDVLKADKLVIKFSFLSIIMLEPAISNIEVRDVDLKVSGADILGHIHTIPKIYSLLPKVPNTLFKNISCYDKSSNAMQKIDSIRVRPESAGSDNVTIHWDNSSNTNISYVPQNLGFQAKIVTNHLSYKMNLIENYDEKMQFKDGKVDYQISNLRDYINSQYSDLDLLVTQIASTEPVHATCDINYHDNGISISKIELKSDSILMNGDISLFEGGAKDQINLHFSKIDLNKILKSPDMLSVKLSKGKSEIKLEDFIAGINITADNIDVAGFNATNFKLEAVSNGSSLNISKCSALVDKNGEFNVAGLITQNTHRSEFVGSIKAKYGDASSIISKLGYGVIEYDKNIPVTLTSDIRATAIDYSFSNLYAKVGDVGISGDLGLKFIGLIPRLSVDLDFSYLDFSHHKYPVITPVMAYISSLFEGMKEKDYLAKYIPLRSIGYMGSFDIIFNNTALASGDKVEKMHFVYDMSDGVVDFRSIYYKNNADYFLGDGKLISTGLKPVFKIHITDGDFATNSLTPQNILGHLVKANKDYDFDKVSLVLDLSLDNLKQSDKVFENVNFVATNDGDLFNISSLNVDINNGKFRSSGSIILDSMLLNLGYAYSNFNINDLNYIYPVSLFGFKDGWMSANGVISSNGTDMAQFIYNLYTKSEFIGTKISWYGSDIDGFVDAVNAQNYDKSKMNDDAKRFASGGYTEFSKISGKCEMDHGVIRVIDTALSTQKASGLLNASYNLYDYKIDSTAKIQFTPISVYRYRSELPIELTIGSSGVISAPTKNIKVGAPEYGTNRFIPAGINN